MQTTFYKTALTLDHKHPILIDTPVALCHVFFGGFVVALACVALWRGHMLCRMLTSFLFGSLTLRFHDFNQCFSWSDRSLGCFP